MNMDDLKYMLAIAKDMTRTYNNTLKDITINACLSEYDKQCHEYVTEKDADYWAHEQEELADMPF